MQQGTTSAPADGDPDGAQALRAEAQRVAASARLRARPSVRKLLLYLAAQAEAGTAGRLKEAVVAIEAFGRHATRFDPRTDSVVRVGASRLRKLLAAHYADEGRQADRVLELPHGSYTLRFGPRAADEPAAPPTLVVLPFSATGAAEADEGFAAGFTAELIDNLAREGRLSVVALGSATRALQIHGTSAGAASALRVRHVLHGVVRPAECMLQVTLHDADRQADLWTRTLEVVAGRWGEARAGIVQAVIASCLGPGGRSAALPRPIRADTLLPEARERVYLSQMLLRRRNPAQLGRALELAQQALQLDPGYAQAYRCAALAALNLYFVGQVPLAPTLDITRGLVDLASRLDPGWGAVAALRGKIQYMFDLDWDAARQTFDDALASDPHCVELLLEAGKFCWSSACFDDAMSLLQRAAELDPLNSGIRFEIATVHLMEGHAARALTEFNELRLVEPMALNHHAGALVAAMTSQPLEQWRPMAEEFERIYPGHPFAVITRARLLAREGQVLRARETLHAQGERMPGSVSPMDWADHWVQAGDFARAFEALDQAGLQRAPGFVSAAVVPEFRPLHADERWEAFLAAHRFPATCRPRVSLPLASRRGASAAGGAWMA